MILEKVGTTVSKSLMRLGFFTRKHSPELLVVGGIISTVASIVLAVKATTKVDKIVKPANDKIQLIHAKMKDESLIETKEYSLTEGKKELLSVYAKTSLDLTKLYAPSAIAFGLSVAATLSSHKIMKGRNLALAAAYTTIENGYKNYRSRVAAKIGEKAERDIFRNAYDEEVTVTEKDKKGNDKDVIKNIKTPHIGPDSDYAYLFDASCPDWTRHARLNIDFLLAKERFLNQKLIAQGYLFLYDAYETLGIDPGILGPKKLQASKIVGWIYDPTDETRDNYVSFGLSDKEGNLTESTMESLREGNRDIWVDFNPDGDILTGNGNEKQFMHYARVY